MRNIETHHILVRKRCGRTRKVRGSKPFAEGPAEAHDRVRKSLRSLRSPFAEADPKIQPENLRGSSRGRRKQKKTTSATRGRIAEGLRGRVVSVMKLYNNKKPRLICLLCSRRIPKRDRHVWTCLSPVVLGVGMVCFHTSRQAFISSNAPICPKACATKCWTLKPNHADEISQSQPENPQFEKRTEGQIFGNIAGNDAVPHVECANPLPKYLNVQGHKEPLLKSLRR